MAGHAVSSSERMAIGGIHKSQSGMVDKVATIMDETSSLIVSKKSTQLAMDNDFVSFNTDGFTENVIIAGMDPTKQAFVLLGGSDITDVGIAANNSPTSTGTQDLTANSLDANVVFFENSGTTVTNGNHVDAIINGGFGTDDATTIKEGEFAEMVEDETVQEVDTFLNDDKSTAVYLVASGAAVLEAEADFNGTITNGFQLDWTTVDGSSAFRFAYVEFEFVLPSAPSLKRHIAPMNMSLDI